MKIQSLIDLFEAFSRRDFNTIREIGYSIALSERKNKHSKSADRIIESIEVSLSNIGYDIDYND